MLGRNHPLKFRKGGFKPLNPSPLDSALYFVINLLLGMQCHKVNEELNKC